METNQTQGQALAETNPLVQAVSAEVPVTDLANILKALSLGSYELRIGFSPRFVIQALDIGGSPLVVIEFPASAPSAAGPVLLDDRMNLTYFWLVVRSHKREVGEMLAWLSAKRRVRVRAEVRGPAFALVDGADRYEITGSEVGWLSEPDAQYAAHASTTMANLQRTMSKCDVTLAVKRDGLYAADCNGRKVRVPAISAAGEAEIALGGYKWREFLRSFAHIAGRWDIYLAPGKAIKLEHRSPRFTIRYYQEPR